LGYEFKKMSIEQLENLTSFIKIHYLNSEMMEEALDNIKKEIGL